MKNEETTKYSISHILFFRIPTKIPLTIIAKISATTTESQIPFIPHIAGRRNIITTWKSNVLKKDITADTTPLFKAVKNADANILNPLIKLDNVFLLIYSIINL